MSDRRNEEYDRYLEQLLHEADEAARPAAPSGQQNGSSPTAGDGAPGPYGPYGAYQPPAGDPDRDRYTRQTADRYSEGFTDGYTARDAQTRYGSTGRPGTETYRQQEAYRQPAADPCAGYVEEEPEPPARRKKKGHPFLVTLLVLVLLLAGGIAAACIFWAVPPEADTGTLGARRDGVSTILLAGTDQDGTRTDTVILACVDRGAGTVNLLSIPRDTLVWSESSVPKINGVYGLAGGGEAGMEALMDQVENLIGFRPDGYALIELDAFTELVDLMGGVTCDVPQDMYYVDPAQDLYIDLKAGTQTLNGEEAMGLVRYRSGYALADLTRVEVQRQFVADALDQWVSLKNIPKLPKLYRLIHSHMTTDLTDGNLLWLAVSSLMCGTDGMTGATLPGTAISWNGSYYQADAAQTAALISASFDPYEAAVTADQLNIRTAG